MYTQADLEQINAQEKKRWLWLAIPEALLLGGIVFSLVIRQEWLTVLLTCVAGGAFIFCYDMFLKPVYCYKRHLTGVLQGRTRTIDGLFKSLDHEPSLVEGVSYYGMTISVGAVNNEEDDRLFYFDAQKPFPELNEGDRVHIVYHDKEVAELVRL